ncbi:MAG TPA: beta-propeller domain-containing protein, partial [Polyangiaceae bacterium]
IASIIFAAAACTLVNDPKSTPLSGDGVFESDAPKGNSVGNATADTVGNGAVPTVESSGEASRAIEEADIIKIEGSRLYALSQYGGLSIIDISLRDQMRLLGRKKVQAQPFEMYVRDQVVFALYNGYGEYVAGDKPDEWRWVTTSYVMAFDTRNPEAPAIVGRFSIPGTIQDSRIVGNAMYVIGYEQNSCWGCDAGQHTTVISLDVSTPTAIRKVAQRSYADDTTNYSWKRSVTVTDRRMYIAGPQYGSGAPIGSEIQVVDISDPNGQLVDGIKVSASGKIDSRWQMDETNGVLRVISQPGDWRPTDPPRIQTFAVASAQSINALANVAMVIPRNETLRSVRFDGPRGYAITAEQKDPLFTVDLSDPAQPKQVGELEMPGWIYYMEPRAERVVALGYDQGNSAGALAVSLFDVSDLSKPALLDRVNFGGNWAWLAEDQDRIHKAFQVLDSANLILMPFSGNWYDTSNCNSSYQSGVQLIDWASDKLTLQGIAPTIGQARRGFLHDSRLFTVSDERVETFDVSDRSKPLSTDSLKLTQIVSETVDAGTAVVKIGQNWYSQSVSLDTTTLAAVEDPSASGHIDVAIGQQGCNAYTYLSKVVAGAGRVYLLLNHSDYGSKGDGTTHNSTRLVTVDVSNPTLPTVIGEATLDFGEGWQYYGNSGGLTAVGSSAVLAGGAIVALGRENIYETTPGGTQRVRAQSTLYVIDPKDPNQPGVKVVEAPESLGTTGLMVSGKTVAFGHYTESPTNAKRLRFYVDRLDVSNPNAPVLRSGVNVPGSPVAFDASSNNVVTVDYRDLTFGGMTASACNTQYPNAWFEYDNNSNYSADAPGTCHIVQETINLVALGAATARVLAAHTLDMGRQVTSVAVGTDRVFLNTGSSYYGGVGVAAVDCMDCGYGYGWNNVEATEVPLFVVSGLSSSEFAIGSVMLSGGDYWSYGSPMVASGTRALTSSGWRGQLSVVDATNVESPQVVRQAPTDGYVQSLNAIGGMGIASMYYDGVQTIRITD